MKIFWIFIFQYVNFNIYRNVMIKEMLEEIRLENYRAETQAQLEENESIERTNQLVKTWHIISQNEQAFMDYSLESKEEDEVNTN